MDTFFADMGLSSMLRSEKSNNQRTIRDSFWSLAEHALDWLLPPVCPLSGEIVAMHGMISSEAWAKLSFITDPKCGCCGIPFAFSQVDEGQFCGECLSNPKPYTRAVSTLVYSDSSRDLILGFKHGDRLQAVPVFLPWMVQAVAPFIDQIDVLVPVPLHYTRLIRRRYNQAALLSSALAVKVEKENDFQSLKRVRKTKTQGRLNPNQREHNVSGAFSVGGDRLNNKTVLLIDDVYTTGATVNACTRAMLKAGAKEGFVLSLAKVVRVGEA